MDIFSIIYRKDIGEENSDKRNIKTDDAVQ